MIIMMMMVRNGYVHSDDMDGDDVDSVDDVM